MLADIAGADLALVVWCICAIIAALIYGFSQAWAAALTSAAIAFAAVYFHLLF